MNDPIKKFVEQHREAFDHMEPPAAVLEQLQQRLKAAKTVEEKKTVPLFSRAKWIAAASVFLAITTAYFFYNSKDSSADKIVQQSTLKTDSKASAANQTAQPKALGESVNPVNSAASGAGQVTVGQVQEANQAEVTEQQLIAKQVTRANREGRTKQTITAKPIKYPLQIDRNTKDLYARLGDSSSSSIRLSAILDIEKSNSINKNTLNNLAKTLNHDSNSNVRLAALEVMSRYVNNKHVSSLLVNSFSTQNDPLVQLGLIGILGRIDNVKVEDRLFALADDPNTFGAVKDEAYLVLLNQNKL